MFNTWMDTSNVGRTTSRPFCGWGFEAIVEVGGGWEESAWDERCEEEAEPLPRANLCSHGKWTPKFFRVASSPLLSLHPHLVKCAQRRNRVSVRVENSHR
jgi:hypothetical protein